MNDIDSLCQGVELVSLQNKPNTVEYFQNAINTCEYVRNCKSNKNKEECSLSSLIDRPLSQSDCIKLGTAIEKNLKSFIIATILELKDIKRQNTKGKKEKDHLFIDEKNKTVYYAEIKGNLNLDTEKGPATVKKCIALRKELSETYPCYTIKMYLVSARYVNTHDIKQTIKKKYSEINSNLVGVNDYLLALGYEGEPFTQGQYKVLLNIMADRMFDENK